MDAPISWWYSDGMTSRRTCRKPLQFPLTRDSYINVIIDPHRCPYTPCCIRVYHVVYPRSLNGNCVPCLSAESPRSDRNRSRKAIQLGNWCQESDLKLYSCIISCCNCCTIMTGWWFGNVWNMIFWFFHILGTIIPFDELIFLRGLGQPPTRWYYIHIFTICIYDIVY